MRVNGVIQCIWFGEEGWKALMPDGTYMWSQNEWYCVPCRKQVHGCALSQHLISHGHQKNFPSRDDDRPMVAHEPAAPSPVVRPGRWQALFDSGERWLEHREGSGWWCIPCRKCITDGHIESPNHINCLRDWRNEQQLRQEGYPPPEIPHLAWAAQERDPPSGLG